MDMEGESVYHPSYGHGIAQFARRAGFEYQVRFDSGEVRWIRTDELELGPSHLVTSTPSWRTSSPHFRERKIVEGLRLGVVPDDGLELFTCGREPEIEQLRAWLHTPEDATRLLIGQYGSGKTHLLNYLRLMALNEGFAVSLIEMDPQESPFSKPKRVYHQIARNLQWRDGTDIRDFRALLRRDRDLLRNHAYFRYMASSDDSRLWEWIDGSLGDPRPMGESGDPLDIPAMYDYTTAANIYCYLISGLGWLCQTKALGHKGLLILFDESEALHAARGTSLDRSLNFMDALIDTADNNEDMLQPPLETGYRYARHAEQVPFLYRPPCGLKLLFAFTSSNDLWVSQLLAQKPIVRLAALTNDNLSTAMTQLRSIYQAAYAGDLHSTDYTAAEQLLQTLDRPLDSTRSIIKGYVEALDVSRFGLCDGELERHQQHI